MNDIREINMLRNKSTEAIIIIGVDKTIVDCNTASLKLFKSDKENIVGADFATFIPNHITTLSFTKLLNLIDKDSSNYTIGVQLKRNSEKYQLRARPVKNNSGLIQLSFHKLEKKLLKSTERVKIDLAYLTKISSELAEINDEDKVFELLGIKLGELIPKGIIIVNRAISDGTWLKVEKVIGIPKRYMDKIGATVGYNPIGQRFRVLDNFKQLFSKPKLHKHDGNLYDFSNHELPESIAFLIERTLKIKTIHTIGIAHQDQFFGFIHFLNTNKKEIANSALLESIVFQCYLSLSRIKSVKALEERERQYKILADNVKDVIFTLDLNLNYTYVSPSIKALRGYDPVELIGTSIYNSLTPKSVQFVSELFQKQLKRLEDAELNPNEHYLFEVESLTRDGIPIWNEVKASFIFDKENRPLGLLGITRDVNERKLAERELLKKNIELNEVNAQKDKFFSIIAHDLKNPFGHILNFSSLLQDRYHQYPEEKRRQFIDLINKSSYQIYLLLENLLDWSRSQGRKMDFFPQTISLDKTVSDILELLYNSAASKNIELVNQLSIRTSLYADEYMLRTILRNLIGNAIKFTPDGGKVYIEANEKDSDLIITITDTGIGMDQELMTSLFSLDPNVSRKGTKGEKGTGLGLILCREFVEKHGGSIWVNSNPGEGSIFAFSIPKKLPSQ